MAKMVHQHPDGYIIVRDEQTYYADLPENLEADFGVAFPPLPEPHPVFGPVIERIYIQGVRHTINAEGNTIGGGEMPWPLGDQLIANVQTAINRRMERDPPPPPPVMPKGFKMPDQRLRGPRMPGT